MGDAPFININPIKQITMPVSEVFNMDCVEGMKQYPDKFFDLAIVDPPYGIGKKLLNGGHNGTVKFHEQYALNEWDNEVPTADYWRELFRVSKNQIVWGANYFIDYLYPSRGVISWDKNLGNPYNFSHWEMAWTSFDCIARRVVIGSNTGNRVHPTQKPVKLYSWLLENYAKPGDKILDTHLGSGSQRIAAYHMGYDFTAFELSKDHYMNQERRFKKAIAAPLFDEPKSEVIQVNFFDALDNAV